MVILMLEPGGLCFDMDQKIIAALKPRPAFLPILRMLNGIAEYDKTRGQLLRSVGKTGTDGIRTRDLLRDRQTC